MKTSCPIIDIHASWLALNPIHGCPFSCKYCFLNAVNLTSTKPVELVTPKEAVNKLINFDFYNERFPLCLFTSTDIFGTDSNIKYAIDLLEELHQNNIKNPIIFITKKLIPNYFLDIIDKYEAKAMQFIFLLSYSGLDKDIEKGIDKNAIRTNFVNLHSRNKKIIHYWRPFFPENSTSECLNDVYNFVKKYSSCSISIGLKVQPDFIDNIAFWNKLYRQRSDAYSYESVWTKKAYDFIQEKKAFDYPIFNATSCALSYVLKRPDYNAFYKTKYCEVNNCTNSQKKRCAKKHKMFSNQKVNEILKKFKEKTNYKFQYSIDSDNNVIKINKELKTAEIVYLKMLTNMSINCKHSENDYYWATTNSSKEILLLED